MSDNLSNLARAASRARPAMIQPPSYFGIKAGAFVIRAFALVFLLIGGMLALQAVSLAVEEARISPTSQPAVTLMAKSFLILPTLALLGASALFFMLASLAIAVRDIARNSFHRL